MQKTSPRLCVHMVGANWDLKRKLAGVLLDKMPHICGSTVLVDDLRKDVCKRFEIDQEPKINRHFVLSLESAYFREENGRHNKKKNVIVVDSIVDRFVRTLDLSDEVFVFYDPRLFQMGKQTKHFFLYGPTFDRRLSETIAKYDLPVQIWTDIEKDIEPIMESIVIRAKVHADNTK